MTEAQIQKQILEYLCAIKIFCWKNHSTGIYDPNRKIFRKIAAMKGVSDILGVLPNGRFLAIEVKKPGSYPSKEQKKFLKSINENGGLGFVARSFKDVQDRFTKEVQRSA